MSTKDDSITDKVKKLALQRHSAGKLANAPADDDATVTRWAVLVLLFYRDA